MKIAKLLTLSLSLAFAASDALAECGTVTLRGKIGETIRVGDPPSSKGHTHGICQWYVRNLDAAGCTLNKVTVTGYRSKPDTTISVTRLSDGAVAANRSVTGTRNDWSWSGRNLNCSTLGCGSGRYVIKTDGVVPNQVCNYYVNVTFELL